MAAQVRDGERLRAEDEALPCFCSASSMCANLEGRGLHRWGAWAWECGCGAPSRSNAQEQWGTWLQCGVPDPSPQPDSRHHDIPWDSLSAMVGRWVGPLPPSHLPCLSTTAAVQSHATPQQPPNGRSPTLGPLPGVSRVGLGGAQGQHGGAQGQHGGAQGQHASWSGWKGYYAARGLAPASPAALLMDGVLTVRWAVERWAAMVGGRQLGAVEGQLGVALPPTDELVIHLLGAWGGRGIASDHQASEHACVRWGSVRKPMRVH
jgi:hypothetical protein